MTMDKGSVLICFQISLLSCLFFIETQAWKTVLYIFIFIIALILLLGRRKQIESLRQMKQSIDRSVQGDNFPTRILANDEKSLNEMIFSVNQLLEQLEKIQIEALRSETARKQLLSSISHDIRTPLSSVIGYVDALKDGIAASKEEQMEYLEIIYKKAASLKTLVDEIFHMAKLDADDITLKVEPLDFAEVVRESIIEYLPQLKNNGMELEVNIPNTKCPIIADRNSMTRIINNLINNAIQYGKEGEILGIHLIKLEESYQLNIWDRGPGIPKNEIEHVFERMYRSDLSRNRLNGGSGLGLAISKALVEKHGGTIWVQSAPWDKTTFSFTVPKGIC